MKDEGTIRDYFNEFVYGSIFQDLDSCIKAQANFLVALGLMSYTEYLGGLLTGNLGIKNQVEVNFNKALEYFEHAGDGSYYLNFHVLDKNTSSNLNIYEIFRNGLVHEYFPKGKELIIVYNEPRLPLPAADQGVGWINQDGQRILRFHCNAYFRDLKQAFDKYFQELIVKKDSVLLANFYKSINNLEKYDLQEITS